MKQKIFAFLVSLMCIYGTVQAETIIINDIHELQITDSTEFKLNGKPINSTLFEQVGTGRRANLEVNGSGTSLDGTVTRIDLIDLAIGPISSTDPLMVMQQPLTITSDTIMVNIPGDDIANLSIGDTVMVSGTHGTNSQSIEVSRIEFVDQPLPFWLLTGEVSSSTTSALFIGPQALLIDPQTSHQCASFPPEQGEPVLVILEPANGYIANQDLGPVQHVQCLENTTPPPNPVHQFSGPIESISADKTSMVVEATSIVIAADTLIYGGTLDDLDVDVAVEVLALEDEQGVLTAHDIFIINGNTPPPLPPQAHLYGPVSSTDPIEVLGQQLVITPDSELINIPDDDINNLVAGDVVAVEGALDEQNGHFIVYRIEQTQNVKAPEQTAIGNPGIGGWVITGWLHSSSESQWQVGNQTLAISPETQISCFRPPLANDPVLVMTAEESPYTPGMTLTQVQQIICLNDDPNNNNTFVEHGPIEALGDVPPSVTVAGHTALITPETQFINGSANDLAIGSNIELTGIEGFPGLPDTALMIFFIDNQPPVFGDVVLLGPLTTSQPYSVLFQEFATTAETELVNIPNNDLSQLQQGDILMVSVATNNPANKGQSNGLQATRVEYLADGSRDWMLSGIVDQSSSTQLSLGQQNVVLSQQTHLICNPNAPITDEHVIIHAAEIVPYTVGAPLDPTYDVICDQQTGTPPGDPENIFFDGTITAVDQALQQITLADHVVQINPQTQIIGGEFNDFVPGLQVDVFGIDNGANAPIDAIQIVIYHDSVQLLGPVTPSDIIANESIHILGQTILITPETQDPMGIAELGLSAPAQVFLSADLSSDGTMYARYLGVAGPADANSVEIYGLANQGDQPQFHIADFIIDTQNSELRINNLPVDANAFFDYLDQNDHSFVNVIGANFDDASGIISSGIINISQRNNPQKSLSTSKAGSGTASSGSGVVTRISIDKVFSADFEN